MSSTLSRQRVQFQKTVPYLWGRKKLPLKLGCMEGTHWVWVHKLTFSCCPGINYWNKFSGGAKINVELPWHYDWFCYWCSLLCARCNSLKSSLWGLTEVGFFKISQQWYFNSYKYWRCLLTPNLDEYFLLKMGHFYARSKKKKEVMCTSLNCECITWCDSFY